MSIPESVKKILRPYVRKWHKIRDERQWLKCVDNDVLLMQHLDKLLSYQYRNDFFNRFDTIVRYLAVEEYYGKNDFGFYLYKKMQDRRGFVETNEAILRFKKLIESVETKGFDEYSALPVGINQELIDGSHRLALAIYHDQKLIPLKVKKRPFLTEFGLNWFHEHGFNDDELQLLEITRKKIFYQYGIYFQIIIWPPAIRFADEIENDLRKTCNVLRSYRKQLGANCQNVIKEIYASDDIEDWKIEKKLKGFESYNKIIHVIEIEIPNPSFRKKQLNNHDISIEVETLKQNYRNKYRHKIENYFYDIIMHIGDNFHHTREIAKVLNRLPDA